MHRRLRPALSLAFAATLTLVAVPALACERDDAPPPPTHTDCGDHAPRGAWAHRSHGWHAYGHSHHHDCDGGTTENPPVEETPPAEPVDDADTPAPEETPPPAPEETPEPTPEKTDTEAPSTPTAPDTGEPATPVADEPTQTPPAVETETIVLATPLPAQAPESLAETGPVTSLAIPCMIASITAGAGMLLARRRAMGL